MEAFRARLQQASLSVLCGPSGVGKSSVLNALMPHLGLRVGAVSGRLQGVPPPGMWNSSPDGGISCRGHAGVQSAGTSDDPRELAMLQLRDQLEPWSCRFRDCLQAGRAAVQRNWERYPLYPQLSRSVLASAAQGG